MAYEYVIFIFIFVEMIFGLYRGLFRQLSFLLVFISSMVLISFIKPLLDSLFVYTLNIDSWYDSVEVVLDFLSINQMYFRAIFSTILPFILLVTTSNIILYNCIFKDKSYRGKKYKEVTNTKRLLGLVIGVFTGVVVSIFLMPVLNGIVPFELDGIFSSLIKSIPSFGEFIDEISMVI